MVWVSGSMVLLKHKHRVQQIHRSLSSKLFTETKATQRILILLSSFVVLYVTSVILLMYFLSRMELIHGWSMSMWPRVHPSQPSTHFCLSDTVLGVFSSIVLQYIKINFLVKSEYSKTCTAYTISYSV